MKILGNFDTELSRRLYFDEVKKYGRDKVLFVRRNAIYLLLRVGFPLFLRAFLSGVVLWVHYRYLNTLGTLSEYIEFSLRGLILGFLIYILQGMLRVVMNYLMDFVIISPEQISAYDQSGLLNRSTKMVDTEKIKTINIEADGWLSSIFNYGTIIFLAEGDAENGDITLRFITAPVRLREKIYKLIDAHTQEKQGTNKDKE